MRGVSPDMCVCVSFFLCVCVCCICHAGTEGTSTSIAMLRRARACIERRYIQRLGPLGLKCPRNLTIVSHFDAYIHTYIVPQTAVRMGFLLVAKELVRSARTPADGPFGSTARSDNQKHNKRNVFVVPERKNKVNAMLFLPPSAKAQ